MADFRPLENGENGSNGWGHFYENRRRLGSRGCDTVGRAVTSNTGSSNPVIGNRYSTIIFQIKLTWYGLTAFLLCIWKFKTMRDFEASILWPRFVVFETILHFGFWK